MTDLTEIRNVIVRAIPLFVDGTEYDDDQMLLALIESGLPMVTALRLLEFMPLAFGRAFMDGMGVTFCAKYVRLSTNGKRVEKLLVDELVYCVAFLVAREKLFEPSGVETFKTIGFRSAEFKAVNSALLGGSKPEDLVLSPTVLWDDDDLVSLPAKKRSIFRFWKRLMK
jgi:hypothetical protein